MANALIPNEITLWYKSKTALDPETGEETQAIIRQPSLGWNVGDGVLGIFVSENQLYMVPLSELEGVLVEYAEEEAEDGMESPGGVDEATAGEGDAEVGGEAEADAPSGKVYVPNFGKGDKSTTD